MPHPGDPGVVAMPGVCPTPGLQGASRSRGLPDPGGAKRPWSMPGSLLGISHRNVVTEVTWMSRPGAWRLCSIAIFLHVACFH